MDYESKQMEISRIVLEVLSEPMLKIIFRHVGEELHACQKGPKTYISFCFLAYLACKPPCIKMIFFKLILLAFTILNKIIIICLGSQNYLSPAN